jgi:RNA-directed DNA polymerase
MDKPKALDKGNCGVARPRGKEAGVKPTSSRTETGYKAGDADEFAPQNEVPVSTSQVKPGVVSGKSRPLPRETCAASSRLQQQPASTATGNRRGERAGVSRGRSSAGNEPGVSGHLEWSPLKAPEGLTHARRTELIETAETVGCFQLEMALDAKSGHERSPAAEKDRSRKGEQWERVFSPENINAAWRQVRQNAGAAGIDRMSIAVFPAFIRAHWTKIRAKLQNGTYRPSPVRRATIPKKPSGKRPLGIPTVLDRVIQQALAQELSGVFEETFSENSHAYRTGRNAHQALHSIRNAAAQGNTHAVDCDLKSFFDHVDHDLLMVRVARKVKDKDVLRLIGRYLRAGVVLPNGQREPTPKGVPQGGPLSPLLANIMLTPLDRELERRGLRFARYADDFLIVVPRRQKAEQVMTDVVKFVEKKLKLTVNPAKSRVAPLAECTFLGCQIRQKQIRWSQASEEEFRTKVRELTGRSWGVSMEHRLKSLSSYVNGWIGYYRISHTWGAVVELDKWLRRRVRQCYWKQWKRAPTRRRNLLRMGAKREDVHLASRSRKGCWRMSSNSIVQAAMTNAWLEKQGVPSLQTQWTAYHYPPKPTAQGQRPATKVKAK